MTSFILLTASTWALIISRDSFRNYYLSAKNIGQINFNFQFTVEPGISRFYKKFKIFEIVFYSSQLS